MIRYSFLLALTLLIGVSANAQNKTRISKLATKKANIQSGKQTSSQPVPVDTPQTATVISIPPPPLADTTKKDTAALAKVATTVADSVVAQVAAPIVQIPVTIRSLIIPSLLFTYGAITLNNGKLREINEEAQEIFWTGKKYTSPYPEDYTLLIPAATVYALNIFGIKGQNNLVDRSILYGMSNLFANGISFGLKKVGIEIRPDSSDLASFPSGHTAEAFVSAEFLRLEYRNRIHWSVLAAGYGVAVGTAYLRMAHNKHWLSDVVAGAGIGIASTRFAYYIYPIIKHAIFGSRKIKADAMLVPTYNNGMIGFTGILRF
jgi:hypothetical protein